MNPDSIWTVPDNGIDRDLLPCPVKQKPKVKRNRWHGRAASRVVYLLESWWEQQAEPRGLILSGDVGVRLSQDPETTVDIDITYISAEAAANSPEEVPWVDGPPVLGVEILSPGDRLQDVWDKVHELLHAGVGLVWIVDPIFRTVCVYRPDAEPELFNIQQDLAGDPHLPGFRAAVADIFKT
jgi:Uma2 family endonuclease